MRLFDLLKALPTRDEEYVVVMAEACTIHTDDPAALRAEWLPQLTTHADLYQRLVIGRVLGLLDLDDRLGLGIDADGLPAPDWVEIPAGEFIFQADEQLYLPTYEISRYHTTYKQFKAFLDAEDGFCDPRWWEGLAERKERYEIQNTPPVQVFTFWNHPFDGACWYDAVAFCRWWSYRLGGTYALDRVMEWKVRLPTEQEWEKAARGTDGRQYPWGNEMRSGYANFDEIDRYGIGSKVGEYFYNAPSAAGLFPEGASPYGVMDMIGTMWDITLTEYRHGKNEDMVDYYPRVIRGGTWFVNGNYCNAVRRTMINPHARTNGDPRKNDYSFRVMRRVK